MAFDEGFAQRVREVLTDTEGLAEKRMFGGVAWLLDGNMAVGILGPELMVRVGPDVYDEILAERGARPFDVTGRPMRGWVLVAQDATGEEKELSAWIVRGLAFARSLPPK
ncbi:MAG: TfoX/Sxy family protein [Trueperaceae bacterium]|nr:TfoX/Sxy family protein [Trueperaceae bacterium]